MPAGYVNCVHVLYRGVCVCVCVRVVARVGGLTTMDTASSVCVCV